jgi:hypothetical protein
MIDQRIVEAWREAASDLNIRLVAPFEWLSPEGIVQPFEGYLPDFGGPNGMVFLYLGHESRSMPDQFYWSKVGDSYRIYDRTFFIETLNDWGYFGDESLMPSWFRNEPWS